MAYFKYYPHPEKWLKNINEATCELCSQYSVCITANDVRLDKDKRYCITCINNFSLKPFLETEDRRINEASYKSIIEERTKRFPQKDHDEIVKEAKYFQDLIRYATPKVVTWQDITWPDHCGDFCIFESYGAQSEINALADDGDGNAFMEGAVEDWHLEFWNELSDNPLTNENCLDSHIGIYIFRCLECHKAILQWNFC